MFVLVKCIDIINNVKYNIVLALHSGDADAIESIATFWLFKKKLLEEFLPIAVIYRHLFESEAAIC